MMKKVLGTIVGVLTFQFSVSIVVLAIVVAATAYISVDLVKKNPETMGLLKGPELLQKEEEEFIRQVGESIALPDEKPTVATVTDLDKLTGQAFFASAKEGDKVLIYKEASKVILYRPGENRVVEVGTVNVKPEKEVDIATSLKVALVNGTNEEGLVDSFEAKIKEVAEVEVVNRNNAVKRDYQKTVVVNVNGEESDEAVKKLAENLGFEVGEMPEGENEIEGVEAVIILGADASK